MVKQKKMQKVTNVKRQKIEKPAPKLEVLEKPLEVLSDSEEELAAPAAEPALGVGPSHG